MNLLCLGFMEKASKRIETDKTIAKVMNSNKGLSPTNKRRFSSDKSDLRHFLDRGASARYGSKKEKCHQLYTHFTKPQSGRLLPQAWNLSTTSFQGKFPQGPLALPLPIPSKSCIHLTHIGIRLCPVSYIHSFPPAGRLAYCLHNWSTSQATPGSCNLSRAISWSLVANPSSAHNHH